jgi:hypothetical protein
MLYTEFLREKKLNKWIEPLGICKNCGEEVEYFSGWQLQFDGIGTKLTCGEICAMKIRYRLKGWVLA